jgi:hypothetical protein
MPRTIIAVFKVRVGFIETSPRCWSGLVGEFVRKPGRDFSSAAREYDVSALDFHEQPAWLTVFQRFEGHLGSLAGLDRLSGPARAL